MQIGRPRDRAPQGRDHKPPDRRPAKTRAAARRAAREPYGDSSPSPHGTAHRAVKVGGAPGAHRSAGSTDSARGCIRRAILAYQEPAVEHEKVWQIRATTSS